MTILQHLDARPAGALAPHLTSPFAHIEELILEQGRRQPRATALVVAGVDGDRTIGFGTLAEHTERYADGLSRAGIASGSRVLLAATPSPEFFALSLGIMRAGATAVFVDGRMGRSAIAHAIAAARPAAVIGVRRMLRWWPLAPSLWRARRWAIDGAALGVADVGAILLHEDGERPDRDHPRDGDLALISFTSGSGGEPRGVMRTHRVLLAQHRALRALVPDEPGEVHLTRFPALVLHTLACGATTVLAADASCAMRAIRDRGVGSVSAAPAFLREVAALAAGSRSHDVQRVLVGGGPCGADACAEIVRALPGAELRIVYGATEAEPIASTLAGDVIASDGAGLLVGPPAMPESTGILPLGRDDTPAPVTPNAIGEVVVRGAHVSPGYFEDAAATLARTVLDERGAWHRTGDVARVDGHGRLWLLGRTDDAVTHRGRTLYPLVVETAVERGGEGRFRVALLAGRRGAATLVYESISTAPSIARELRSRLAAMDLGEIALHRVRRIPLDTRHRSKIDRAALRRMVR